MEWYRGTIIKEVGSKKEYVKKEWINTYTYILRYNYKLNSCITTESGLVVNILIDMKRNINVNRNNDNENIDFRYEFIINKISYVITKENIEENINWYVLLENTTVNLETIKDYIWKTSINSFFENDMKSLLNN